MKKAALPREIETMKQLQENHEKLQEIAGNRNKRKIPGSWKKVYGNLPEIRGS